MPLIDNILQPTHLIVVLAIALLVLGPKRLPEVSRSIGRGLRDFKSTLDDVTPTREDLLGTVEPEVPTPAPDRTA